KALLDRLSVFAGGWTLEAAEKVCSGEGTEEGEVLDLLLSLADKSLVVYEEREGKARHRMLETIRQYARDKLRAAGKEMMFRRQHRDYFLALAEEIRPKMNGPEQAHWLEILEMEHDNLRLALAVCLEEEEGVVAGLRLGAALPQFWCTR